jgi:hypothetical protein
MAKKKKKSRLKKLLKGAALAGAAVLGAKALGRRNQMKDYLATEGGARSDMRDYGPFSKAIRMAKTARPERRGTVLGKPGINRMDTSEVDTTIVPGVNNYRNMDMGLEGYYKKGGRVGCGVAKKGFGRALKKGGKK